MGRQKLQVGDRVRVWRAPHKVDADMVGWEGVVRAIEDGKVRFDDGNADNSDVTTNGAGRMAIVPRHCVKRLGPGEASSAESAPKEAPSSPTKRLYRVDLNYVAYVLAESEMDALEWTSEITATETIQPQSATPVQPTDPLEGGWDLSTLVYGANFGEEAVLGAVWPKKEASCA